MCKVGNLGYLKNLFPADNNVNYCNIYKEKLNVLAHIICLKPTWIGTMSRFDDMSCEYSWGRSNFKP